MSVCVTTVSSTSTESNLGSNIVPAFVYHFLFTFDGDTEEEEVFEEIPPANMDELHKSVSLAEISLHGGRAQSSGR